MKGPLAVTATLLGLLLTVVLGSGSIAPAWASDTAQPRLIDRYRQALAVDPDNLRLHYFLGVALLADGRDAEAIAALSRGYPALAETIEANYNLGLAHARLGDPDSALLYFEQAESLGALDSPEIYPLAPAYYNLGLAYQNAGALDDAERLFSRVLTLHPEHSAVQRLLGQIYARKGESERALEAFGRALKQAPDDTVSREFVSALQINRALAWLQDGKDDLARSAFDQALRFAPESADIPYYLGYLDYRAGAALAAAERLGAVFTRLAEDQRSSARAMLYNAALTLHQQGRNPQALQALAPLLAPPATDAEAWNLAGNIHRALKEFVAARRSYQQVLDLDPAHRKATLGLIQTEAEAITELTDQGTALATAGEVAAAWAAFEAALAIDPAAAQAQQGAARARQELAARAEQLLDQARTAHSAGRPQETLTLARQAGTLWPQAAADAAALETTALGALQQALTAALEGGKALLQEGRFAAAGAAFAQALDLDPAHPRALQGQEQALAALRAQSRAAVATAESLLRDGKLGQARQAFEALLHADPDLPAAKDGLEQTLAATEQRLAQALQAGRKELDAGRFEAARNHFAQALELKDDAALRSELARVEQIRRQKVEALIEGAAARRAAGDFKGARLRYDQAQVIAPQHPGVSAGLKALQQASDAASAEELAAGQRALIQKDLSAAMAHFRQVLDLTPDHPAALQGMEEGRRQLQAELTELVAAGQQALERGDFSAAQGALQQALALEPYHPEALKIQARLEELQDSAIKPGDEQRLYLEGISCYTRGNYRQALEAWGKVLLLVPGHEKARLNIEKAQRKLRHIEEYRGG